jgi:hypothetical protein
MLLNIQAKMYANLTLARIFMFIEKDLMSKVSIILEKLHRRISRMMAHLASLPAQISWGLSKPSFVDKTLFFPRYQKAIEQHQSQLPILQDGDARIVEALKQEGIFTTSLDSLGLPDTEAFLKAAQHIAQNLKEQAARLSPEKNYEVHATKEQLMHNPELFSFGLNDRLLKIVESYLGLPVAYDGVFCFLSIANGEEYGARAWHRDREDRRMIKICIYLNDVDENGGPFEFLKPEFNDRVCESIKYPYKSVFLDEMEKMSSDNLASDRVSCVGKAGTVIIADTGHFYHRGKPPIQTNRTAVFLSYFSRSPWHPFFCQRTPLTQKEIDKLAPRFTPEQLECVKWKKDLPKAVRWIPKSAI